VGGWSQWLTIAMKEKVWRQFRCLSNKTAMKQRASEVAVTKQAVVHWEHFGPGGDVFTSNKYIWIVFYVGAVGVKLQTSKTF